MPNPIDVHVGRRVRLRRMMQGMSQEELADSLGLTFQQVQKYEKGTNRISASKLHSISQILNVPIPYFFEGLAEKRRGPEPEPEIIEFLLSREGVQLNRAFMSITKPSTKKMVLELIDDLATG